jgi:hypothetical protein
MDPSRIKGGAFNLPQFVGELRELRDSLGLSAWNFKESWLKLVKANMRFVHNGITFRDVIKAALSADLARKFALEPTIADIKNLISSFDGCLKMLDKLQNGHPFRVYGSSQRTGTNSYDFTGYPYTKYWWGNAQSFKKKVITWAMIRYTNPLGSLFGSDWTETTRNIMSRKRAIEEYYRLNAPVRTAWELMPLSFVVDWFIDLGSWLDRFDGKISDLPYEVIASGYSVKKTADSQGYIRIHAGTENARLQDITAAPLVTGRLVKTSYSRVNATLPWTSPAYAPPKVRIPSFGKLVTLLELSTMWSGLVTPNK